MVLGYWRSISRYCLRSGVRSELLIAGDYTRKDRGEKSARSFIPLYPLFLSLPPHAILSRMTDPIFIGADVGGTSLRAARFDGYTHTPVAEAKSPTFAGTGPEAVLQRRG